MEGRSGLERLTWRALGEAALKQVSVVTGRLSAPVASSFLCLSHFHHLYHKLVTGSSHCFHSPEEEIDVHSTHTHTHTTIYMPVSKCSQILESEKILGHL